MRGARRDEEAGKGLQIPSPSRTLVNHPGYPCPQASRTAGSIS